VVRPRPVSQPTKKPVSKASTTGVTPPRRMPNRRPVMTPEDEERLIPASTDLIVKVDAEKQTIAMRIPAGLLDL